MSIIEQVGRRRQLQLAAAWKRYTEIIRLEQTDDPAMVDELAELCELLDRDPADLRHDAEILRVLSGYEAQAAQGEGIGEKLQAAELAANQSAERYNKEIAKLQEAHAKTLHVYRELKHRHDVAEEARRQIHNIKQQHPHLFPGEQSAK